MEHFATSFASFLLSSMLARFATTPRSAIFHLISLMLSTTQHSVHLLSFRIRIYGDWSQGYHLFDGISCWETFVDTTNLRKEGALSRARSSSEAGIHEPQSYSLIPIFGWTTYYSAKPSKNAFNWATFLQQSIGDHRWSFFDFKRHPVSSKFMGNAADDKLSQFRYVLLVCLI